MPAKKSRCCCCGVKCHHCFAVVVVLIVAVVVGYFAYLEYSKEQAVPPYTIDEVDGVTTVTPGPGLVPDGPPPVVSSPTVPPPTN